MKDMDIPMQTNPHIDIIGPVELISFTEEGINEVPARVDTGAIYSSVWASNISIQANPDGGTLSNPMNPAQRSSRVVVG